MYDIYTYARIRLTALARTERGASAVEYGLLVTLIALVVIGGVTLLGGRLSSIFNKAGSSLTVN